MNNNPFKPKSTSYADYEILKDLEWHCAKHELKSGQAKTWQIWRQNGLQFATDMKGNYYLKKFCNVCGQSTVHRALKSLDILENTTKRSYLPKKLVLRIKSVLKFEEALFLRTLSSKELEVDHKFPQVRWGTDEPENSIHMSESEIKNKYILLTSANNLLKSRRCEVCKKTNIRSNFPGIYFWYQGTKEWDNRIDPSDEKGCVGCFWYDPYKWREELNKLIK